MHGSTMSELPPGFLALVVIPPGEDEDLTVIEQQGEDGPPLLAAILRVLDAVNSA